MKHVAVVGPDFAPSSMPPALRIRLFAQHLPEFGWRPTVIATDPRHYPWPIDPRNEHQLPDGLEVIRTSALPSPVMRKLGIGDIGMRSLWHHWRALSRLCQECPVDLVFFSVPPYATAVLGPLVYRRFGIPYVIDYQDPWITEYYWRLPREQRPGGAKWVLSYILARALEPFAIRDAAHIVGVSSGTTEAVTRRYRRFAESDTSAIPFGGEPADFAYLSQNPGHNLIFQPGDGLLHVSYVGACIPAMHAALRALFSAVRMGIERAPSLFERLRLHFVGTTYAADGCHQVLPLAEEMAVSECVQEHPQRVAYFDSLQILLDSHALLLLGSEEPHYTASKVFPCILARRPLIGLFHEASSAAAVIRETQAGVLVTFSSHDPLAGKEDAVFDALCTMLSLPGTYQPPTRWDVFGRYTARSMTGQLATVFDSVIETRDEQPALPATS